MSSWSKKPVQSGKFGRVMLAPEVQTLVVDGNTVVIDGKVFDPGGTVGGTGALSKVPMKVILAEIFTPAQASVGFYTPVASYREAAYNEPYYDEAFWSHVTELACVQVLLPDRPPWKLYVDHASLLAVNKKRLAKRDCGSVIVESIPEHLNVVAGGLIHSVLFYQTDMTAPHCEKLLGPGLRQLVGTLLYYDDEEDCCQIEADEDYETKGYVPGLVEVSFGEVCGGVSLIMDRSALTPLPADIFHDKALLRLRRPALSALLEEVSTPRSPLEQLSDLAEEETFTVGSA